MRKYLTLILAVIIFVIIHESVHVFTAMKFNEFQSLKIHYFGVEVLFKTPVAEREGIKWGFISGASNAITILLGYIMFFLKEKIRNLRNFFARALGFQLTVLFMIIDALNLSVLPFFFGGDINGVALGFGINKYLIQGIFFIIFLINRELVAQKLLPSYGVITKHPLFQPWIKLKTNTKIYQGGE